MCEPITEFRGDYIFLSNFYLSPIRVSSLGTSDEMFIAPTAEHVFQAMKTKDPDEQQYVLVAPTAVQAKRRGRQITLREDWEDRKVNAMMIVVRAKFEQNSDLADKLIATGDAQLIEGSHWGDTTWGAVWNADEQKWIGINMLGRILMDVREEIRTQGEQG